MYTDSHNHTCHFSSDAEMSISELILEANSLGIPRIAVTEHYEMDYPHKDLPPQYFDPSQYNEAFDVWRKLCTSGTTLLMGIEIGYQPHLVSKIDNLAASLPFDTVILSNHLIDGIDVYFNKECYKQPKEELHRKYIGILAEMAEKCSNYDIIGHYDYIDRYSKRKNTKVCYSDCPDEFDMLFKSLISKGKSLEINTKSIHKLIQKHVKDYFPDESILLRYKELGGEMITLGSDSHSTNTLAIHFEETAEFLKSLGFKYNTYFVHRSPVFEEL